MSPQKQQLTVGSLFSGIGGLELGLERAGMRTVWQVEKDAFCRKVLARHWPSVTRFEDVKDVGKENLAPVDLICGGFPCQDISRAGNRTERTGLDGARSGLWAEFSRIICGLRPRYVVVENVPDLLYRGLGDVLGDLASLGYDAQWDCIPASAVGAPQTRDRVFVVAYADRQRVERFVPQALPRFAAFSWCEDVGSAQDLRGRPDVPEPLVRRTGDGLPNGVDRLTALGNAVVPQVAEYIGRLIVEADKEMRGAA